jgi:hypothetical protein
MFAGMFSPPDADTVLSELGDKFLTSFAGAVTATRSDIVAMRAWNPGWFPGMSPRCLSNIIHDRIWAHVATAVDDDKSVSLLDNGPTREIQVGLNFRLRVKRHREHDMISTYATQTALDFWLQGPPALPGLELITLAAGYRWDADLRAILAPVVSYRDGKDNPIWAVELSEPITAAEPITWTPAGPSLPSIDLGELVEKEGEDEGGQSE